MINLMPYDQKKQLHAAHMNVALLKYFIVLLFATAFLIAACGMTFVFLQNNNIVKNGDHPLDFSSSQVTEQGEILHDNLVLTGKLLNQQVKYSKVMTEIAKTLPKGSILNKLSISLNDSSQTEVSMQIFTTSGVSDKQIQTAFTGSPMFINYKTVSYTKGKSANAKYQDVIEAQMLVKPGATL